MPCKATLLGLKRGLNFLFVLDLEDGTGLLLVALARGDVPYGLETGDILDLWSSSVSAIPLEMLRS